MAPLVSEDVGTLWLLTLQRGVARAAHDVKDALNGVSVNLEVVRSRAARADTPASAVAKYGEAAGQQLERLTTLMDAILALTRVDRSVCDVGTTLRRVTVLCGAASSPADAAVRLGDSTGSLSTLTTAPADVVRLALTAPLLEVVAGSDRSHRASEVTCSLASTAEGIVVTIAAAGRRASMPAAAAEAVRAGGVHWTEGDTDLSLTFPRAPARAGLEQHEDR